MLNDVFWKCKNAESCVCWVGLWLRTGDWKYILYRLQYKNRSMERPHKTWRPECMCVCVCVYSSLVNVLTLGFSVCITIMNSTKQSGGEKGKRRKDENVQKPRRAIYTDHQNTHTPTKKADTSEHSDGKR